MHCYLGIDPGWSGALAVLYTIAPGGRVLKVHLHQCMEKKLDDESRIVELCDRWRVRDKDDALVAFALLERAQAFPKQGVSSCFMYGRNYGAWRAALAAARISYDLVSPAKWQRALGCLSHGDKKVTLLRAHELFPGVQGINHSTADALLIAEYLRRTWATAPRIDEALKEQA